MNKHSSVPYVLLIDIEDKLAEIIYEYDAIELTQALAKSVNKETDAQDPFISSTRDVLRENIDCLSDDEKFEFIAQVKKLSYVKHNSELRDAINKLAK